MYPLFFMSYPPPETTHTLILKPKASEESSMKNPDRFNAFLSRVPQATEWQRIGNQINATMILARANLVNVCSARHSAEIQSQRAVRRKACRNRRWHVPKPLERPSQVRGPAVGKFRISRGVSQRENRRKYE
jgi:hypothetical protein